MSNNTRRLVYGVGVNDLPYPIKNCPFYEKWRSILCRCYSSNFHTKNKSYEECFICDEWIYASNFKKWMESKNWKGNVLDKDILYPNNKIYSPEKCIFVPIEVNSLLVKTGRKRIFPLGVYKSNTKNKFDSKISIAGKTTFLGSYSNKMEAHREWQKYRFNYIKQMALKQEDSLLKNKLLDISRKIENDYNFFIETK